MCGVRLSGHVALQFGSQCSKEGRREEWRELMQEREREVGRATLLHCSDKQ